MKSLLKNFPTIKSLIYLVLVLLTAIGSMFGFIKFSVLSYLESPMNSNADAFYYDFKSGSNLTNLVTDLEQKNIITKPKYLLYYAMLNNKTRNLDSGIYKIDPKLTPIELLDMLDKGGVAAFNLRTNEGNTFKQMMISISLEKNLKHTLKNYSPESVMNAIGLKGKPYEGYFYPDTYNLPYGLKDTVFLTKAYREMETILEQEWQNRDKSIILKNKHELLTLASIIEKETTNPKERFDVSSVFHNRLKINMRLQADPTVIYGMGDKYKGNIRKKDLRTRTPFNTYRIYGLPPTPICMPGRKSINAAAHPNDTNFLYFVATGNNKLHKFSATYKEHRKAVNKYQRKRTR